MYTDPYDPGYYDSMQADRTSGNEVKPPTVADTWKPKTPAPPPPLTQETVTSAPIPRVAAAPSSVMDIEGVPLYKKDQTVVGDDMGVLDRNWAKQAFMVADSILDAADETIKSHRYWTIANNAFVDSRLGGAIGINARPGFTRYSDIRVKGRVAGRKSVSIDNVGGNHGPGRFWFEAIENNSQTIYIRAGVPQFSSLSNFFSQAFSGDMIALAKSGRANQGLYTVGNVLGKIASIAAFPALASTIIVGQELYSYFSKSTSKFVTLKPTMHLYWSAVNMLANSIAVNKGIMPRVMYQDQGNNTNSEYRFDTEHMDNLHNLMPDTFTDSYGYNVFAIANRAQRMHNAMNYLLEDAGTGDGSTDPATYLNMITGEGNTLDNLSAEAVSRANNANTSLASYIERFGTLDSYYGKSETNNPKTELNPKINATTGDAESSTASQSSFMDFFKAEFNDGTQFAIFKVDAVTQMQESFTSSAVESDLSQKFNGVSSQVREARFSFADGNLTDGVVSDMIGGAMGAVKDVVTGALDGVSMGLFSSLAGLAGSGFIDIQKHWQSSSVQLPTANYTMQLISPYGNAISQMQNIFIPLSMLMALALPRSTGKQSYDSPFMVQLFDRGHVQIQYGLVTALNITRGTSNLPFNNRGKVMAIDVSLTVTDLSSIMHMPISTGSLFTMPGNQDATLDEDNILFDYLAVLAGQDLYSQLYAIPKAKLKLAKKIRNMSKLTSPAYWSSFLHEEATSGLMSYIMPVGRAVTALAEGTATLTQPVN